MVGALLLTSCKEEDEAVPEEFPNWAQKNDAYFVNLFNETKAKIDGGSLSWMLLPSCNLPTKLTNEAPYPYQ